MDETKKISYQSLKEKLSDNQLKRIIAGSGGTGGGKPNPDGGWDFSCCCGFRSPDGDCHDITGVVSREHAEEKAAEEHGSCDLPGESIFF